MDERTRRAARITATSIAVLIVLQGGRWLISGERPATGLFIAIAAIVTGAALAFATLRVTTRRGD